MESPTTKNVQDTAGQVADRAREAASNVADKARDVASAAAGQARDTARAAGRTADSAAARVGSGMGSLADTIRENAPKEGMMDTAASRVADGLESAGRYLEQEGLTGISGDLTELIKRNPVPALLIGLGIGFLLARATRS